MENLYDEQNGKAFYNVINHSFLLLHLSKTGEILSANDLFLELSQYTLDEIHLTHYYTLMNNDKHSFLEMKKAISLGRRWKADNTLVTKKGEVKRLESTYMPILDEEGELVRILALLIDRTDAENASKFKNLAFRNELTGLPNRRELFNVMDSLICQASEKETSFAVMFMDLNNFKTINDTYGHHIGDQLLIEAGKQLSLLPFESVHLFHLSGDEFIVLLEDTTILQEVIDYILSIFKNEFELGLTRLNVSASMGISLYPTHSTKPKRLLQLADQAMYKAKNSSHCEHVFTEDSHVLS